MIKLFSLIILFAGFVTLALSQHTIQGVPSKFKSLSAKAIPVVDMPEFNVDLFLKNEGQTIYQGRKTHYFAKNFTVNIHSQNSGLWEYSDNSNVWQLQIRSRKAKSIGLVFERFHLKDGEKLFIYNENEVIGALTEANNTPDSILAIRFLQGERITLEFSTPYSAKKCGTFSIAKVAHDFTGITTEPGGCNININCNEGAAWQTEKRAVVKMYIYKSSGAIDCTGTLINNAKNDATPYILTAEHCVCNDYESSRTVFYFMYESQDCAGTTSPNTYTISGSKTMATYYDYDFSLLKLPYMPPMQYKPYYAGWSLEDNGNLDIVVSIHHPWGGVKKIAYDSVHPVTGTFVDSFYPPYASNAFWKINRWDGGVTENGSSGGPLFDEKHRIVGTLTGGDAVCGNTINDYFEKLASSFASRPTSAEQLKYWLDPNNTGITHQDGFDPYPTPFSTCNTLSNIATNETITHIDYEYGTGSYAGTNSDSITEYAEKFNYADTLYISGIMLNVAKASNEGGIQVRIYKGNEVPDEMLFETYVSYSKLVNELKNYIDVYPAITTNGNVFISYKLNYTPNDTFGLKMASPRPADQPNTAFLKIKNEWVDYSTYTGSHWGTSLDIKLMTCKTLADNVQSPNFINSLRAYPNPASQFTILQLPNNDVVKKLSLYNLTGALLPVNFSIENKSILLNLKAVTPGIYFINVSGAKHNYISKIVITR